jgi:hypothetical protein
MLHSGESCFHRLGQLCDCVLQHKREENNEMVEQCSVYRNCLTVKKIVLLRLL